MLTLYTYTTGNGRKASILLEELGLAYTVVKVDLRSGENRLPSYLAVSPLAKIPAVVEELPDGTRNRIFGSGAILLAFAERTGTLLPTATQDRLEALSWLTTGLSDLSPARGAEYWLSEVAPEPAPKALARFHDTATRCFDAAEARLADRDFLAGDYSIADIAFFPYVASTAYALADRPNLRRWHDTIAARPAVQRGMAVPA